MSIPVAAWGPLIGPSTAIFVTGVEDAVHLAGELLELHADIRTEALTRRDARSRRGSREPTRAIVADEVREVRARLSPTGTWLGWLAPRSRATLVLPSVDVVLSHGGAGTTLGAIEHGLPHVVLPQQTMSQLRNAQRVHALGLGVHLAPGSPPDDIPAAVRQVLNDRSYAEKANAIRGSLETLPSHDETVAGLESLFA
jgi:hypothetical protein